MILHSQIEPIILTLLIKTFCLKTAELTVSTLIIALILLCVFEIATGQILFKKHQCTYLPTCICLTGYSRLVDYCAYPIRHNHFSMDLGAAQRTAANLYLDKIDKIENQLKMKLNSPTKLKLLLSTQGL